MDLSFFEKRGSVKLLLFMLNKPPLRFKELKKALPREATLSLRLRELEELKLIQAVPIKDKKRRFFAYNLTKEGIETAKQLKNLKNK
ncbi:winged helix-turn-helix transcriptional regulator [Candidatus Micrarchaeota archaeon]|nr:winged helix-turn-helix transcriptional regulator [Candidatus Micrarchaeota archaeon]